MSQQLGHGEPVRVRAGEGARGTVLLDVLHDPVADIAAMSKPCDTHVSDSTEEAEPPDTAAPLLQVILNLGGGPRRRLARILVELAPGTPLAQQIPALVQGILGLF